MNIKIMSEQLANQIAAGEVVERPSAVIKECLENSFDAGAKSVEVIIEKAGSQLIVIKDDGQGIAEDNLELAICRHATSKIICIEDLESLNTMGFRGEALASIASVSSVKLTSRRYCDSIAWCLKAVGGKVVEKIPMSMPAGTRVEIVDLFYNTPARRRFMRSERTEMAHIEDVFKRLAMSRPEIEMKLFNHDKLIYHYPKGNSILDQDERLIAIMGKEWFQNVIPIQASAEGISLTGFLSKPPFSRKKPDSQYLFVNGRSIRDHFFSHALKRAVSDLLYQDQQPTWILQLAIDPSRVDVNIHPTKDRVRFSESSWVYDWVYKTIRAVFRENTTELNIKRESAIKTESTFNFLPDSIVVPGFTKVSKSIPPLTNLWDSFKFDTPIPVTRSEGPVNDIHQTFQNVLSNEASPEYINIEATKQKITKDITALCQFNGAYVVARCDNELWLVDVHAAHERQLMETLLLQFQQQGIAKDHLLLPIILPSMNIAEHLDIMSRYGFEINVIDHAYHLMSHPRGLSISDAFSTCIELIDCIQNELLNIDQEMLLSDIIANIACQLAVKASRIMTLIEIQYFFESLSDLPEVCNHGRPWKRVITIEELDKFFMRGQ